MVNFDYISKAKEFVDFIGTEKQTISIILHKNPDGDAIGSGLALSLWLQKLGHNVKILAPTRYSDIYAWLPNSINILVYNSPLFHDSALDFLNSSNIVINVDFGQKKRIDESLADVVCSKEKIMTIDHHLEEIEFTGYKCLNSEAASSCEMIYEFFASLDRNIIDDEIAICLYVGIITDTARFMTSNMTPRVHEIAADLLSKHTINVAKIYKDLYGNNRYSRLKLVGHLLNRCMRTMKGYSVGYIYLSLEDANRYKIYPGDTEGIVNYPLSIRNVTVAAMFKEKEDGVYISLRSIGDFSVNEMASKYFNGGGHKNASGGSLKLSLEESIAKFEEIVQTYDELKYVEQ